MDAAQTSLRSGHPGRPGATCHEVVAGRLEVVRDMYIALVPDIVIKRRCAVDWSITRKAAGRYLQLVKAKYQRERTEADADFLRQLEGVVVANIQRARDTERRAADAGEFKGETAAQAQQLRGVERLCAMRGLDAAKRIEVTKGDPVAKMTPDERRERAMRALKRQLEAMPVATGEGETH